MATTSIPPLRYQKGSNGSSPNKAANRPLSELSPMAIRRNSPSFPQGRTSLFKAESSPAASSPFSVNNSNSPHSFWQKRDPASPSRENQNPNEASLESLPSKRSSIENLKKASRVKNSNIFAKEQQHLYDPARPTILDGRPLSVQPQGDSRGSRASDAFKTSNNIHAAVTSPRNQDAQAGEMFTQEVCEVAPLSPSKLNLSPAKSSLSKKTGASLRYSGFDPENGIWEDEDDQEKNLPEGRSLHRYAKSVTFDQAPPQVNEYEMTTPDPSSVASGSREGSYESLDDEEEDELSFERGSSMDHDDSFDASLEDTDKTPVVLPEDWRFMSPDIANTDLAQHEEDVFDDDVGSPGPAAVPGRTLYREHQTSINSVDSNGQPRPLPPLPPMGRIDGANHRSRDSLSGTIERMSSGQRALPSPPPAASITKSEIRRMSGGSLSIEDRLRLMMIREQQPKSDAEAQRDRRMRRAESKEISPVRSDASHSLNEHSSVSDGAASQDPAPRLDRSSILKQLREAQDHDEDMDQESHSGPLVYDPDVPIPSMEDPTQPCRQEHQGVMIKQEESDDDNGLYSIPDMYCRSTDGQSELDDEETSQYSQPGAFENQPEHMEPECDTPRAHSPVQEPEKKLVHERISLPEFMDFGDESSFNLGLSSYMTPPLETANMEKPLPNLPTASHDLPDLEAVRKAILRPQTPEEQLELPRVAFSSDESLTDPGTPNSVIRHPISQPPNLELLDEARKSNEVSHSPDVTIPEDLKAGTASSHQDEAPILQSEIHDANSATQENPSDKRVSSLVQLQLPDESIDLGLGLGLEQDFDRVVETQKRGYLMRQNTKVVVASERTVSNEVKLPAPSVTESTSVPAPEPNEVYTSARKASQPTWTSEPWNSKSRRRSIRVGGEKATAKRKPVEGPVPPLPGFTSNVQDNLGAVAEDELAEEEAEELEDGVERGRLFVKVVGVKDLQIPMSQHERTQFALTLDNGLHCVTTAWLDLAKEAPIGQEFELVVLNELEFQLTLQMKLEEPKVERAASPSKPPPSPKKQSAFGRLFGSPKKKDSDHRFSQSQEVRRPITPPSAYELVQGLVAKDGSFARAYVSLSDHEKHSYGRPYHVDIKCFNEWAMEEVNVGSSRSKKSVTQMQRRPPYEIGKLEVQLLYVPKPKGAKDEDMPKSMNGAVRALREAEEKAKQQASIKEFQGYLSQQGGDCPYWRRRYFKLVGSKFTAYHESTLQPRATINLNKANKLIDDKSALVQKETSTKGGGRRKSAFAEEEEGYMFVEEGFRIRFANGEVIDFYADSAAHKDEWMQALSQVVGKNITSSSTSVKGWTEMVLKREKISMTKAKPEATPKVVSKNIRHEQASAHTSTFGNSGIPIPSPASALPRPSGHMRTESYQGNSGSRSQASSPIKSRTNQADRQTKARSIAF